MNSRHRLPLQQLVLNYCSHGQMPSKKSFRFREHFSEVSTFENLCIYYLLHVSRKGIFESTKTIEAEFREPGGESTDRISSRSFLDFSPNS